MKTGRNEPCPCGSGKKYKKCCLINETQPKVQTEQRLKMRKTSGSIALRLAMAMSVINRGQTP